MRGPFLGKKKSHGYLEPGGGREKAQGERGLGRDNWENYSCFVFLSVLSWRGVTHFVLAVLTIKSAHL